jgi:hypothetical protein
MIEAATGQLARVTVKLARAVHLAGISRSTDGPFALQRPGAIDSMDSCLLNKSKPGNCYTM